MILFGPNSNRFYDLLVDTMHFVWKPALFAPTLPITFFAPDCILRTCCTK